MKNKNLKAVSYPSGIERWNIPVEHIFAGNGETEAIPADDPTLRRINYSDGFSYVYSTKPSEGGANVPRLGFNSLFKELYAALQEIQMKTSQIIRNGVTAQGFNYTLEWLPDGNIIVRVWGAADLAAGSGSQGGGNDIVIALPYEAIPEHSGYSVMLRPPAGSTGIPYAYVVAQTSTSVTFHTSLFSASAPIHYHIDLRFMGDVYAYPPAPTNLKGSVADTTGTVSWQSGTN